MKTKKDILKENKELKKNNKILYKDIRDTNIAKWNLKNKARFWFHTSFVFLILGLLLCSALWYSFINVSENKYCLNKYHHLCLLTFYIFFLFLY